MSYKQALRQQEELRRREEQAPEVGQQNGVSSNSKRPVSRDRQQSRNASPTRQKQTSGQRSRSPVSLTIDVHYFQIPHLYRTNQHRNITMTY